MVINVTGTVRRYVAVRFTFSGTRDAFQTTAGFNSGDTEITVDGGTAQERIEVGDMLDIGGTDYEVSAASESGGTWTVTLATGLAANVANNADVTLTGTNTSLRYAAAIKRH